MKPADAFSRMLKAMCRRSYEEQNLPVSQGDSWYQGTDSSDTAVAECDGHSGFLPHSSSGTAAPLLALISSIRMLHHVPPTCLAENLRVSSEAALEGHQG